MVLVVKNLPANAGNARVTGSILGSERSPGGGHGDPLQYSRRENPMDRGAWWATARVVAKSRKQLKRLSLHTCILKSTSLDFFFSLCLEEENGVKDFSRFLPVSYIPQVRRTRKENDESFDF